MLGAEGNMDIRNAIMQMAASDPQYAKAVDVMEEQVARMPVVPEDLDEAIALLEFVLQNPDKYQEVLAAAVRDGVIDEGMMPPQFDQVFIVSLLVAFYGLQDRLNERGFSRGGLSVAARKMQTGGRGGDTELVHVNRREAEILRRMGGAGTVNPNTGLREYKSIKKLIGAVLPIALSVIAPGIGTAIGTALGASGIGATILGGAVIGGASSALSGGNVLQGALMGGVGAGLGGVVGGGVDKALGLGLGQTGQAILGSGLIGGAAGAATGQGVLRGIGQGVLGGAIGELAGTVNAPTAFQQGIQQAGRTFGQGITVGYDPKTAAISGGLAGLARGITYKPSESVVNSLKTGEKTGIQSDLAPVDPNNPNMPGQVKTIDPNAPAPLPAPGSQGVTIDGKPGIYQLNTTTGKIDLVPQPGSYQYNTQTGTVEWKVAEPSFWDKITGNTGAVPATTTGQAGTQSGGGGMGTLGKLALGATALQALSSAPPAVQQAVQQMSPEQQEYFTRPAIVWDWEKLQRDAAANNQSLSQFMAQNWPNITSGAYNVQQQTPPPGMAHGGALGAVARFARGAGSGRSDTINAKLSDGEYVMDAETVAMLGDGSSKAGAQRLDKMREELRAHKGKALAKGKFSPNAKSPLSYLKEVA
jgi:hypothetical protein